MKMKFMLLAFLLLSCGKKENGKELLSGAKVTLMQITFSDGGKTLLFNDVDISTNGIIDISENLKYPFKVTYPCESPTIIKRLK